MRKEVTLRMEESRFDQFMGFIRLYSEVEIISEGQCRRTGRGGRPKRASKPVTKAFCYRYQDKAVRLMNLYKGLVALGWISSDTDCQLFIDLFGGGDCTQRIVWMDDVNTLADLFRRLVSVERLVAVQSPYGLWQMVDGHFWEKEGNKPFGNERLRKTHTPQEKSRHINYLVNILHPRYSEQQLMEMLMGEKPEDDDEST